MNFKKLIINQVPLILEVNPNILQVTLKCLKIQLFWKNKVTFISHLFEALSSDVKKFGPNISSRRNILK